MRAKNGKVEWTPMVFAFAMGRVKMRSAMGPQIAARKRNETASFVDPETPARTPATSRVKGAAKTGGGGLARPRNAGSQRAENPQTTGTRNPQPSRTRYF